MKCKDPNCAVCRYLAERHARWQQIIESSERHRGRHVQLGDGMVRVALEIGKPTGTSRA